MANTKSTKKRTKTNEVRRMRNVARKSELKTAVKKIDTFVNEGDIASAQELFRAAEGKIARAGGKGVFKKNSASRKISILAKKIARALQPE